MLSIGANKIEKYNHVSNISIALHKHSARLKAEQGEGKLSPGFLLAHRNSTGLVCEKCHAEMGSCVPKMAIPRLAAKGIAPHGLRMGRSWSRREALALTGRIISPRQVTFSELLKKPLGQSFEKHYRGIYCRNIV